MTFCSNSDALPSTRVACVLFVFLEEAKSSINLLENRYGKARVLLPQHPGVRLPDVPVHSSISFWTVSNSIPASPAERAMAAL